MERVAAVELVRKAESKADKNGAVGEHGKDDVLESFTQPFFNFHSTNVSEATGEDETSRVRTRIYEGERVGDYMYHSVCPI